MKGVAAEVCRHIQLLADCSGGDGGGREVDPADLWAGEGGAAHADHGGGPVTRGLRPRTQGRLLETTKRQETFQN